MAVNWAAYLSNAEVQEVRSSVRDRLVSCHKHNLGYVRPIRLYHAILKIKIILAPNSPFSHILSQLLTTNNFWESMIIENKHYIAVNCH